MFNKDKKESTNPFVEKENIETKEGLNEDTNEAQDIQDETKEVSMEEEKLRAEIDDINNKYLRLAADFDNYRKRQAQERESLLKYGAQDTLKKIIPVLDTIVRAKESISNTQDVQTVKSSFEVCTKQLDDVLDKIGLKEINATGETFDPNIHEAIMQTPTSEYQPHTVIAELQKGYKLFDRVLRPSYVNVAVEEENKTEDENQ